MSRWLLFAFVCGVAPAAAQVYTIDAAQSAVTFRIKNFGIAVEGAFAGVQGELVMNASAPASSAAHVRIDAATVNSGNGLRDRHLRGSEFLSVATHPLISFSSTSIAAQQGRWLVTGNLTIKGHTRSISFYATPTVQGNVWTVQADAAIRRADFAVGGASLTMSDTVYVHITLRTHAAAAP